MTRKTPYAWMALGGLIVLFALVLMLRLRDGNRAIAQENPPPLPTESVPPTPPVPAPALAAPSPVPAMADMLPSHRKKPAPKDPPAKDIPEHKKSEPAGKPVAEPPSFKPFPAKESAPEPVHGLAAPPPPVPESPPPLPPAPALSERPPDLKRDNNDVPSSVPSQDWSKPAPPVTPAPEPRPLPGEPPLAPVPGPVQSYSVRGGETMKDIARRTLGSAERWTDIHKLNPMLKPEIILTAGTNIRLPGDACVVADELEAIKPLPSMHPKAGPAKPKVVLPLTGTYPANLDDKKALTLPAGIREQLGGADTLLISPGPDQCLWLTNQAHLERLAQRLEHCPAREVEVRVFKRLYFAQTEKAPLSSEGRIVVPERLAQFAGLHQEVVLVGIDDHFELWDTARWRAYTQQKSSATHPAGPDAE